MPAELTIRNKDNSATISSLNLNGVPPGDDYFSRNGEYAEFLVVNTGDVLFTSVTAAIQQAASSPLHTMLRIAQVVGSTVGAFVTHTGTLNLSGLAAGNSHRVAMNMIVPPGAEPGSGLVANVVILGSV